MKSIVFFDIKDYEQDYFTTNFSDKCNLIFSQDSLLENTPIKDEMLNAEILSVFTSSRVTKNVIDQFENLKLIATRSVGFSHIDTEYCKEKGIRVVNTPHYGDYTVAEYSFGLLLSLMRQIPKASNDMKQERLEDSYTGMELFGKTIGIMGTGGIGSKAVKIAAGFSMNILAFDLYPNKELEEKYGVKYVSFDELIKNSDVISLYLALTQNNYHLISDEAFNNMKSGVVIVNAARGEIINTEALYSNLLNGKVRGAAIDVIECEEKFMKGCNKIDASECGDISCLRKVLLNHKLMNLENVIITPHIAFDTKDAVSRILDITNDNIVAFLNNLNIENRVV